jgi:RND family efflux transporter MFP subunit
LPSGSQPSDQAAAVALYAAAFASLAGAMSRAPAVSAAAAAPFDSNRAAIYGLCAQAAGVADLNAALVVLVNELQNWLNSDTVCIVLPRGSRDARAAALSKVATFDRRSALVGAFEAAARETMLLNRAQFYPPRTGAPAAANLGELCRQAASPRAWSWPCHDSAGNVVCVCVALLPDGFMEEDPRLETISRSADTIGATLKLLCQGHESIVGRTLRSATGAVRALRRRRYIALAGALTTALMLAPWPYNLPCECVVEPVTRRFVCAPFDGVLDRALVRPGDRVKAGDELAVMDSHELNLQLAGRQALIEQSRQRYTAALAKRDAAAAQFASLELEQAEQEVALLRHRQDNLAIRSPLEGNVVSGDLHRAQGAPLSVGQKLFEIAPLERMVVEASVPEHQIAAVAEGQSVTLSLESHSGANLRGEVIRLHPQAEIRNQKSVFVAEVQLDADEAPLLPGMSGQAQINVGSRPIGWILFHRPWHYLRSRFLW